MQIFGYIRVSTEEQAESGLGLEAQVDKIVGAYEVTRWFPDKGVSTRVERPQLKKALEEIERGDSLVVARLDRLARSIHEFSGLVEKSTREGWKLVCLDPQLDFATPTGRLVANVLAAVAEWEREIIAQRVSEALQAKKRRGERVGAEPRIDDVVAGVILDMREEGMTLRAICAQLNTQEVPTPNGGKLWRPSSIQRLLTRPVT